MSLAKDDTSSDEILEKRIDGFYQMLCKYLLFTKDYSQRKVFAIRLIRERENLSTVLADAIHTHKPT